MERYNPSLIYTIGRYVGSLELMTSPERLEMLMAPPQWLAQGRMWLDVLSDSETEGFSRGTRQAGKSLVHYLRELETRYYAASAQNEAGWLDRVYDDYKGCISSHLKNFQALFYGDCVSLHLFSMKKVLGYDRLTLMESGRDLIDSDYHRFLTLLALEDLDSACRSLAVELPTACVFHVARATEETMRRYYREFIGELPANSQQQTMGSLLRDFEKMPNANARLIADLWHVKNNIRDMVAHPDATYSLAEAKSTLPSCVAIMGTMLEAINGNPNPPADVTMAGG